MRCRCCFAQGEAHAPPLQAEAEVRAASRRASASVGRLAAKGLEASPGLRHSPTQLPVTGGASARLACLACLACAACVACVACLPVPDLPSCSQLPSPVGRRRAASQASRLDRCQTPMAPVLPRTLTHPHAHTPAPTHGAGSAPSPPGETRPESGDAVPARVFGGPSPLPMPAGLLSDRPQTSPWCQGGLLLLRPPPHPPASTRHHAEIAWLQGETRVGGGRRVKGRLGARSHTLALPTPELHSRLLRLLACQVVYQPWPSRPDRVLLLSPPRVLASPSRCSRSLQSSRSFRSLSPWQTQPPSFLSQQPW